MADPSFDKDKLRLLTHLIDAKPTHAIREIRAYKDMLFKAQGLFYMEEAESQSADVHQNQFHVLYWFFSELEKIAESASAN